MNFDNRYHEKTYVKSKCNDSSQTRVNSRLTTFIRDLKKMLSKMMPPSVTKDHSITRVSRKKQQSSETRNSNDEILKSNEIQNNKTVSNGCSNCINSNWAKFRSIVTQQDSGTKNTKRQHSQPAKSWREKRKARRMVLPHAPSMGENLEPVSSDNKESTQDTELTKQIAMDCEMVGIGDGTESMLARVSLVNRHGVCVYDKYVKPTDKIQDYRTAVSGIRPHHLLDGEDFKVVQSEVAEILRGKLLIGHALKNDLSVLFLSHPKRHLRDTSRYKPFRKVAMGNTPSLKKLAAELLGVKIQTGEHNSVEDARTAMQLYVLYKNQWEADIYSR